MTTRNSACLCGAGLIVGLWLCGKPAYAQSFDIALDVQRCESLDGAKVQSLLGIELAAAQIDVPEPPLPLQVTAVCDDDAARALAQDPIVGGLSRSIRWQGVAPEARSRLFALAVAEMLVGAHRDRNEVAPVAVRQEAPPNPPPIVAPASPAPNTHAARVRLGLLRVGEAWSPAPAIWLGGGRNLSRHVAVTVDVMGTHSRAAMAFGEAHADAVGVVPALRLHTGRGSYGFFAEAGAAMTAVRMSGRSRDARLTENAKILLWPAATLSLGVERRMGRYALGIGASVLYTPAPPEARTTAGQQVVQTAAFSPLVAGLFLSLAADL